MHPTQPLSSVSPRPGGLKNTPGVCAHVPKIPRGEQKRKDYGVDIPLEGDFLLSPTHALFIKHRHPIAKLKQTKKEINLII